MQDCGYSIVNGSLVLNHQYFLHCRNCHTVPVKRGLIILMTHWGQNDFVDKCDFLEENVWISNEILSKYVSKCLTNNKAALLFGWGGGLVPNRWQAITRTVTDDGQNPWCQTASLGHNELTHLALVTCHMAAQKLIIIGSGNCLWPGWHQAITCTNAESLSIASLGINFSESFYSRKCISKCRLQNGSHFVEALMSSFLGTHPACGFWFLSV